MIAIVDYGAGNLRSVVNAVSKLGYQPKVTSNPDELAFLQKARRDQIIQDLAKSEWRTTSNQ